MKRPELTDSISVTDFEMLIRAHRIFHTWKINSHTWKIIFHTWKKYFHTCEINSHTCKKFFIQ
jgi:hypothetical protein